MSYFREKFWTLSRKRKLISTLSKLRQEGRESRELAIVIVRIVKGKRLSQDEKKAAILKATDIAKVIPIVLIFILPGGAILLAILAKKMPRLILPSSFHKTSAIEGQDRNQIELPHVKDKEAHPIQED